MWTRTAAVVSVSSLLLVCGCEQRLITGTQARPSLPGATPLVPSPGPATVANWTGNATVISVTRGSATACGWGTTVGETRLNVEWSISAKVDGISLDEDLRNWPTDDILYSGHLTGQEFAASYRSASDYASYVCPFREASVSGRFTTDSTFEAEETLIWGAPGTETTVRRMWMGQRVH